MESRSGQVNKTLRQTSITSGSIPNDSAKSTDFNTRRCGG